MELNGWQRLWVAGSACWIMFVGVVGTSDYREARQHHNELQDQLEYTQELRWLKAPTELQRLELEVFGHDEAKLKAKLEALDAELSLRSARTVALGLVIAVLPPLCAYAIGIVLGWVRRGFQREQADTCTSRPLR